MDQLARIVPCQSADGFTKTQGTQVILASGEKLPGVVEITLHAKIDDVWRATIVCHVQPPEIPVAAVIVQAPAMPHWKRAVVRAVCSLLGLPRPHVDTTTFDATRFVARRGV